MGTLLVLSVCLSLAMSAQGMYNPNNPDMSNGSGNRLMSLSSSSPAPPPTPTSQLYFDWTENIDTILTDEEADYSFLQNFTKKGSKRPLPHIFYTTDSLVSNLAELSSVTDLLDKNELTDSTLYLSFRVTNGEDIPEDHMADVFYSLDSSIPKDKIKSLRNHITAIVLDIQGSSDKCAFPYYSYEEYRRYYSHSPLWDIPFPKYAKKIAQKLLGIQESSSLQVGVIYNSSQSDCYKIAEQLKHADFHIVNVDFGVEGMFALTYSHFNSYLEHQKRRHDRLLSKIGSANKTKVMFRLNLPHPSINNIFLDRYVDTPEEANEIVEETKSAYFPLLKKFAKTWTKEGKSGLILSKSTELSGGKEETDRSFDGKHWSMPYLHVQEVDVNPCQLRTMLGHTASQYSSLVVNEFTWSAFARYKNEMTSKNCPKGVDLPANLPHTYLLFSSGIGDIWNKTEEYFERLLQKHQTISGWHLSTLVFPSKDVIRSTCEDRDNCELKNDNEDTLTDHGIPTFALEMRDKYKFGCLVEFGEELGGYGPGGYFKVAKTKSSCKQLMDISTVIIWQLPIHFSSAINVELNFGYKKLKHNLFRILLERKSFLKEFPDKEVILQITIPNADRLIYVDKSYYAAYYSYRNNTCSQEWDREIHQFYKGMEAWAGIHGVKVIFSPAYNVEEPTAGLWMLPEENGTPNNFQISDCAYETNYRFN